MGAKATISLKDVAKASPATRSDWSAALLWTAVANDEGETALAAAPNEIDVLDMVLGGD